jgi:HAD superfamily hydrolase (TIGR01509 family)
MKALLFDCDGVLVDTERDGHRVAFNQAFSAKGLDVRWDVAQYGELLKIAGGKERLSHFFEQHHWPAGVVDRVAFIQDLHRLKTDLFMRIVEGGQLPLRPGVKRLVDEAIAAGLQLAVCSTSSERAVTAIVETLLGPQRRARFAIFAGDVVPRKKPAPDIYLLAQARLGLPARECLVVEDSRNGLLAAKAAGMRCLVTKSSYTRQEDFAEADLVVEELGEDPDTGLTLRKIEQMLITPS